MLACWKQSSEDCGHTGMGHIDMLIAVMLSILSDKELTHTVEQLFFFFKFNAKKGIYQD